MNLQNIIDRLGDCLQITPQDEIKRAYRKYQKISQILIKILGAEGKVQRGPRGAYETLVTSRKERPMISGAAGANGGFGRWRRWLGGFDGLALVVSNIFSVSSVAVLREINHRGDDLQYRV